MDKIVYENKYCEIRETSHGYELYERLPGGETDFVIGCGDLEETKKEAELVVKTIKTG